MSNLIIKSPNLPIKAYPPQALEAQQELFMKWINDLLGLRGEESAKRLVLAMPVILKKFHSLSFTEVKKAFEMYALGELETKPITNYFDIILVGKVFNDYKKLTRANNDTNKITQDDQDYFFIVSAYDHYISTGHLEKEVGKFMYHYLVDKTKLLEFSKEERIREYELQKENFDDEEAKIEAKISLLKKYFNRVNSKNAHIKSLLKSI